MKPIRMPDALLQIEARREFQTFAREADAAAEESMAEYAVAQGNEALAEFHRNAAAWKRAYRFDWEVEAAGGAGGR